jgi:hypothetical protein
LLALENQLGYAASSLACTWDASTNFFGFSVVKLMDAEVWRVYSLVPSSAIVFYGFK